MNLHYRSPEGWLNDPHGVIFHDGQYHVFHQSVPGSLEWAPELHWGHAVGPDLVSLRYRGSAFLPGDGDTGIWTGCIVDNGGPQAFYTSARQPNLGLATVRVARPADDSLDVWVKGDVVAVPPPSVDKDFRDPFVLRDGERWRMLVGSDSVAGEATAHGYVSDDGETWVYDGVALSRHKALTEPAWMGSLWECPQFFEIDGRWAMLTSVWDQGNLLWASYAVGDFVDGRFKAENWGRLSYGTLYAPTVFRDRDGRVSMIAWIRESRGEGWAGCLSIPYLLRIVDNRLVAVPHPDAENRGCAWRAEGELVIDSAKLTATADGVRVEVGGRAAVLPAETGEELKIFVDDAAIEVVGGHGILALPVAAD